jgi:hypothetical protein
VRIVIELLVRLGDAAGTLQRDAAKGHRKSQSNLKAGAVLFSI